MHLMSQVVSLKFDRVHEMGLAKYLGQAQRLSIARGCIRQCRLIVDLVDDYA